MHFDCFGMPAKLARAGNLGGSLIATETTVSINSVEIDRQQPNGYALQISVFHKDAWFQWLEFEVIFNGPVSSVQKPASSIEVCPMVDFDSLKKMFHGCEENHSICKSEVDTIAPSSLIVIDVERMNIVSATQGCRYCALSYVWGKPSQEWLTLTKKNRQFLTDENALVNARIPQTIRDALKVTRKLGERYLWVDSLCIVQNDPVSQKTLIDVMDMVYASAVVTLVAAAGNNSDAGLPGVSTWLREAQRQTIVIQDIEVSNILPQLKESVDLSMWNSCAWTYQERMFSRRSIFFAEEQAYHGCPERGVQYERKDRLLPSLFTTERIQGLNRVRKFSDVYTSNVSNYTRRSFTNQADILRAFQGCLNNMSSNYGETFYFGIPNGTFEDSLM
jgi:hypothetical protein